MNAVLAVAGKATRKPGIPIERQAPLATESLGLAYLAAALADAGVETTVVDGYDCNLDTALTVDAIASGRNISAARPSASPSSGAACSKACASSRAIPASPACRRGLAS